MKKFRYCHRETGALHPAEFSCTADLEAVGDPERNAPAGHVMIEEPRPSIVHEWDAATRTWLVP